MTLYEIAQAESMPPLWCNVCDRLDPLCKKCGHVFEEEEDFYCGGKFHYCLDCLSSELKATSEEAPVQ
jgi:hypothetical protein